jgi:hypothetical protein
MNLNNGLFSVKAMQGEHKNLVLVYFDSIKLKEPSFCVNHNKWEKVVEEGVRDVCAYVTGVWRPDADDDADLPVSYNPFRCKHFTVNGDPVGMASFFKGRISDGKPITHVNQPVYIEEENINERN